MNIPQEIRLNPERNQLTLAYADREYTLSAEYLRVYSPSAEVRGHGVGQETLQTGKRFVAITDLEAVGNYALKITFSDGHDSGLYDWDYLHALAIKHDSNWQDYLNRLAQAGATREFDESPKKASGGGCGGGSCGCSH
ncbi:gamma-butyrobetaine hydroxylase-like domain-containing protein [Neisseriaceae bacterium B1]